MTNIPPEGFDLKDKVTFDQLPAQLQDFFVGPVNQGFGKDPSKESLWLKETRAVLTFFPKEEPTKESLWLEETRTVLTFLRKADKAWTSLWEKTPDGWWIKVDKWTGEPWTDYWKKTQNGCWVKVR
ncbi:MAG: hypothetical protein ABSA54_18955 [Terriglobales bacterium]